MTHVPVGMRAVECQSTYLDTNQNSFLRKPEARWHQSLEKRLMNIRAKTSNLQGNDAKISYLEQRFWRESYGQRVKVCGYSQLLPTAILFCSYLASGGHFTFQQWIGVTQPRPWKHWRLKRTEIGISCQGCPRVGRVVYELDFWFESPSDHYLNLFLGLPEFKSRATISTWSSKPYHGIAVWRAKPVPTFLSYFRIPNIGLPRGSNPRLPAQQSS